MDGPKKAIVLAALLALAVPCVAGAGNPGPVDREPIDPPLTPKPMATATPSSNPAASTKAKATLRVVGRSPLRLQGAGFRASELVKVTVITSKARLVRQTRAGAKGGFALTFAGVRFDDCKSSPPEIFARASSTGRVGTLFVLPRDCAMR